MIANDPRLSCLLALMMTPLFSLSALSQDNSPATLVSSTSSSTLHEVIRQNTSDNYIEVGGTYDAISNDYGRMDNVYTRASYTRDAHTFSTEVNEQRQFGTSGVYFDVGDTYAPTNNWYVNATVGSSSGGLFWPKLRADGSLNIKWLKHRQWITTLGYGYFRAKDAHRSNTPFVGSTYYFSGPWIAECGLYLNVSSPGSVFAPSGFVAITQGHEKQQYITFRVGVGEEAYQLLGPSATLTRFSDQETSVVWRKWIGGKWGINIIADYYHATVYKKFGGSTGIFREF